METPYWCTVLVHQNGRRKSTKNLEFTISIKALSFHLRTSIRAHKHILYHLKWLYCGKSRGHTFFFQRDSIPILVSWCQVSCYRTATTRTKIYLSLSKRNFVSPRGHVISSIYCKRFPLCQGYCNISVNYS